MSLPNSAGVNGRAVAPKDTYVKEDFNNAANALVNLELSLRNLQQVFRPTNADMTALTDDAVRGDRHSAALIGSTVTRSSRVQG
jgi:hypothetical protein